MNSGQGITRALAFVVTLSVSANAVAQQSGDSPCEPLAQIIRDADIKVRPQGFFRVSGWPEVMKNNPLIERASVSQHSVAEAVDLLKKQGKVSAQVEQRILEFMPKGYSAGYSNFGPKGRHVMLDYTAGTNHCQGFISLSMNHDMEWAGNKSITGDSTTACGEAEFSLIKYDGKPIIIYGNDTKNYSTFILHDAESFSPLCQINATFRKGYAADLTESVDDLGRTCNSDICKLFTARGEEIAARFIANVGQSFTLDRLPKDEVDALLENATYIDTESLDLLPGYQETEDIRQEFRSMLAGDIPPLPTRDDKRIFQTYESQMWFVGDVSSDMDYFGYNLNAGAAFRLNKSTDQDGKYELRYLPLRTDRIRPTYYAFDWAECAYWECKIEPFVHEGKLYFFRIGEGWLGWRHYPGLLLDVSMFDRGIMKRILSGSLKETALGVPAITY